MELRDYTFLGMTQSLCPACLAVVPAKIISRAGRVYFRKRCATHGMREDFVCSDVRWFDRIEFSLPGKVPPVMGIEPRRGCPYDCGLCTEHEQHTCIGLVEITSSCNLTCPLCYAESAPGGRHLSLDDCIRAIERLVEVEGRPEVLQLSGGEPTIHPQFLEILDYACAQPIDIVMINTNGIRFAHDAAWVREVARHKRRIEVYFQFDGFDDRVQHALRGESLLAIKLRALDALAEAGLRTILVATLQPRVNDDQIGELVKFAAARRSITGVSFQPATYTGRYVMPEELEQRITFPDVIRAVSEQTDGLFRERDFSPLPCAHPNGHSLAYAYRAHGQVLPLGRFVDLENHLDLLANGITFTRASARALIEKFLSRQCCGSGGCGTSECNTENSAGAAVHGTVSNGNGNGAGGLTVLGNMPTAAAVNAADGSVASLASEFFGRALSEDLAPEDMLRITTTSFMDAYNFDLRQLMKSCVHQILPSGHVIPFSAYNVLYRNGHVPLPELRVSPVGVQPAGCSDAG